MKKMIIMTICVVCSLVASANLELPSDEEITRMCIYTNKPAVIVDFVYPVLTNMWMGSNCYTVKDIERFQLCLYLNMMAYTKSNDLIKHEYSRIGVFKHTYLMEVVFSFPCFRDNTNAVYEIADYIGAFHVPTEEENISKIKAAIKEDFGFSWDEACNFAKTNGWDKIKEGESYKKMVREWWPMWKNRHRISNYRKDLFWALNGAAVDHWKKTLTPEEFAIIRSNFIHRAKMSKAEEAKMFR
jgi:hypothetical protein